MGEERGGGGGGAPKGAEVRGQVGLTKKEQNQRAVAQEKGSRQSANVAGPSSRAGVAPSRTVGYDSLANQFTSNYGAMSPEDLAEREMDRSVDQFTTSTTGAFRDLDDRVNKGQISQRVQDLPSAMGMAATGMNKLGKYTAGEIRSGIQAGGTPVYDSIGRIQGVVRNQDTAFGKADVYTGSSSYNPIGTGKKAQPGIGYVMSATDVQASERRAGGGDNGGGSVQTAATATNVTGSTTRLSDAAKRKSVQALGSGGASVASRQFLSS